MRLVSQSRTVGQPINVTPIENPFSPSVRRSNETVGETDREKSQKAEKPPPIFIKNVTNINALITQIQTVNPGEFTHSWPIIN